MANKEIDDHSGLETTGHEWDGIKELNRPLPRWWLYIFYASIVYAVVYWILMPAWPGINGYTRGLIGNSERANVAVALAELDASRSDFVARLDAAPSLEAIENDPALLQFALAAGASAFGDNCATCHGAGAQGFAGYPNLNDDVWLWGGGLDDIRTTLMYGIRAEHLNTRLSQMPAFGRDGLLMAQDVDNLVEYVVSLSGGEADAAAVAAAEPIYQQQCAICHAADGTGDRMQGAPNLVDAEWLYGGDRATLRDTIWNSRQGVMPHWSDRLDQWTIDALAVYVHSLGGGE